MLRRNRWFIDKGHNEERVLQEYLQLVRYRHDEYIEPTRWHADLVMNSSLKVNQGFEVVSDWILTRLLENRNPLR